MTGDTDAGLIGLISVMTDAIQKNGVGPKRAVETMDTIGSIADLIIALVVAHPEDGPDQVKRAVAYVAETAADMKRQQEEIERKREAKKASRVDAQRQAKRALSDDGERRDLDATADEIAARVDPAQRSQVQRR
jgi:hypothetical protein